MPHRPTMTFAAKSGAYKKCNYPLKCLRNTKEKRTFAPIKQDATFAPRYTRGKSIAIKTV